MNRAAIRKSTKPALVAPTLEELFATDFPTRAHLITPWLRQGESALIWSEPGLGKSMLSLSIALAIAGGGELMGWTSPEPRRVLIVDGEQHIEDIVSRAKMLLGAVEGIDAEAAARNITVLARQHQDPDSEFPDLAEDEGREEVFRRAVRGRFDLVILDNFSTLATVEDENSAAAFDPVIKFLLRMKQAGIATVLVHHSNKTGKDFRGSSKLATTFEVIMGLQKPTKGERRLGTWFDLEWTKFRQLRDETTRGRTAWLQSDPEGRVEWQFELSTNEEAAELVRLVRTQEYRTQAELAEALGCSTGKLSKLKYAAIHDLGMITQSAWGDCLAGPEEPQGDF